MTNFAKGGRGKKPPYETTHHRIPEPCKDTVKILSDTWKHLLSDEQEGATKAQKLLTDIENIVTMHYTQEFDKPVNGHIYKAVNNLGEIENKLGNKLLKLLKQASGVDARRGTHLKKIVSEAIALLEQEMK